MTYVSLVLYDSVLFQYGGKVHRWANSLERGYVANATRYAPKRSGELAAGIRGETVQYGPKHWQVHIHSEAQHTMYVLRGTTGPIMSRRMWGFRNRTGLRYPRGAMEDPSMPYTTRIKFDWLKGQGYMLKVRPGNGYGLRYSVSVKGQKPNNFFADAHDATARRHRSLRPGGMDMDPHWGF